MVRTEIVVFLVALKPKLICFLFNFNLVGFARSRQTTLLAWDNLRHAACGGAPCDLRGCEGGDRRLRCDGCDLVLEVMGPRKGLRDLLANSKRGFPGSTGGDDGR